MSFPLPSITPPVLTTWQLAYGGLAFGGVTRGATYQLKTLPEGLDIPDYLAGDVQRALDDGEFAGLDLAPGRNVTVEQVIRATTDTALDVARQNLAGVLGPAGSTEQPLYVQLASGCYACMARPRKHHFPTDITTVFAKAAIATTLWHATDPRWYAMPTKTSTVGLPEPSGGLAFPFAFPTTFSGSGVGGIIEAANNGKFEMRPRFIITGPCINPKVTCLSLPGAPSLAFEITLNAGDTLTIDTDFQSVVLVTAGSTAGSSRRNTEKAGNTWFSFSPGVNTVEFTSEDAGHVAGTLTVQYADAYLGL